MLRKRDGLLPIGDVFSGLGRTEKKALQKSPQARHHFTQADQVNQLVSANEADPDLGFHGAADGALLIAPDQPGNRLQYKRVNGPFKLVMYSSGETKLPMATCLA